MEDPSVPPPQPAPDGQQNVIYTSYRLIDVTSPTRQVSAFLASLIMVASMVTSSLAGTGEFGRPGSTLHVTIKLHAPTPYSTIAAPHQSTTVPVHRATGTAPTRQCKGPPHITHTTPTIPDMPLIGIFAQPHDSSHCPNGKSCQYIAGECPRDFIRYHPKRYPYPYPQPLTPPPSLAPCGSHQPYRLSPTPRS